MGKMICQKCGREMDEGQFYTYNSGEKVEYCKKCLTMHIDNFDPETFLWALEKMDVPYIPEEWNALRDKAYAKDPKKMNGMSVFGKYLSKMKLKQFKDFRWADTETINAERAVQREQRAKEEKEREAELKEKYDNGEISDAEFNTLMSTDTLQKIAMSAPPTPMNYANSYNENNFMDESELPDVSADLTDDDKKALAMKWGRLYQPYEWVELEKDYQNMRNSFDIQDADTENTLLLICKTNLKMHQAIDTGDLESFQKISKVSESLRKSAKFTAAQNKEEKNDFLDSVGELVAFCERDGFIPRFETDIPQDKVDATLKDMNNYLYKLVTQDLGFGQQIENALKKIQIQKEMQESEEKALKTQDETIEELIDEDYEKFYASVQEQKEQDKLVGEEE